MQMMREAGIPIEAGKERRVEEWGARFEEFLVQREAQAGKKVRLRALNAWKRFLRFTRKLPWEATAEEAQEYAKDLEAQGLKPTTVYMYTQELAKFYRQAMPEGPNPAKGAYKEGGQGYQQAIWLCAEEVEALLGAIDRETSLIAKRDYALLTMYLTTGQEAEQVRRLQWRAVERQAKGTWVHWRRGHNERRERLPQACEQALLEFLEASGRLEKMQSEGYVFPPQADPGAPLEGEAQEWDSEQALSMVRVHESLQRYAEWAGIQTRPLSVNDLRHTAVMLRVQAGASAEDIHEWLGIDRGTARYYVKRLMGKGISEERREAAKRAWEKGPFERRERGAQEGNLLHLRHGLYAKRLPEEEVKEAIEKPKGLEEAIANLQVVMERALKIALEAGNVQDSLKILDIYSLATIRLANALRAQEALKGGKHDELGEAIQEALDIVEKELGLSNYNSGVKE